MENATKKRFQITFLANKKFVYLVLKFIFRMIDTITLSKWEKKK